MEVIIDGIINLDSALGRIIGFTSERFTHGSYLWKDKNIMWISFISSKIQGKGYFHDLMAELTKQNFTVKIPTPMGLMKVYVQKHGFKRTLEETEIVGHKEVVEVWVK